MARINYSRAFDLSRQFYFGDWTDASISATATAVTLNLNGARIVLGGNFTLAGSQPTLGTITSLTYSTVAATAVTEFAVTNVSMSWDGFQDAMADGDFNAVAGNGADWVSGSTGGDKLYGGTGNDKLEGLAGNDSLFGGAGNDTLDGGAGNDSMQGGYGDDVYIVDSLQDKVVESAGGGTDTVRTGLAAYTLGTNIENLQFTGLANAAGTGNGLNNLLVGGRGNDSLSGLDGNDTLRGGLGADNLTGGNGNDLLVGDVGGNSAPSIAAGASSLPGAQHLTVSMAVGDVSATNSTTLSGFISLSGQDKGYFNVAVVLDVSSQQYDSAGGFVNDNNGDGIWNQKLDAEIAAFTSLVNALQATGLGDKVRVALINAGGGSVLRAVGVPGTDWDGDGVSDLIKAAQGIRAEYTFSHTDSYMQAARFFGEAPSADNILLFVGAHASIYNGSYAEDYKKLLDPAGINASIRALSYRSSDGYNTMDQLDNGVLDHSALNVSTPAELTAGLLASRVDVSDISRLEIYKNGVLFTTLAPSQLVDTPLGLRYSVAVTGLNPAGMDDIEARLVFKSASPCISTSQQIGGGVQSFNDSLVGGNGDDTLDGSVGMDILAGGAGNDVYRIGNATPVIQELANQGVDGIEVGRSFSLNTAAYQNIENLKLLGLSNINATGNVGNNIIEGNNGNNVITGLGGNDTLMGGLGFDIVDYSYATQGMAVSLFLGRAANYGSILSSSDPIPGAPPPSAPVIEADQLSGIEGVWGSAFGDSMEGSTADEIFRGNGGDDTISGGGGFDTLDYSTATAAMTVTLEYNNDGVGFYGEARCANESQGIDRIESDIECILGSAYADSISGAHSASNNKLVGGAGDDTLIGGHGFDTLIGGAGKNVIAGGSGVGFDWVDYSAATAAVSGSLATGRISVGTSGANVDSVSEIEGVILSAYADSMAGGAANECLDGGAGNDTLIGNGGNDTLRGGTGADNMAGGDGDDVYYVDSPGDIVTEAVNGGTDTVYVGVVSGSFVRTFNGIENIFLAGNAAFNVSGGSEKNSINGSAGNDTINGGAGTDQDSMYGGDGIDWVSYADHRTGVSGALGYDYINNTSEIDGDYLYGFENFLGSAFADNVTGNTGNNILSGGAGNDTLSGSDGDDTLDGGTGNDLLSGGNGADTVSYARLSTAVQVELRTGVVVTANEGIDTLSGVETIVGGSGNDVITWTDTPNSILGSTGFRLEGGAGNDSLTGGAGADTLAGGAGDDVLNGGTVVPGSIDMADVADYRDATAAVVVDFAAGTATGGAGNDKLINIERVLGSNFADRLTGSMRASEYFWGGSGADTLDGGVDNLSDYFCYARVSDSTAAAMDTILYRIGDIIDLSAVDANGAGIGDGAFAFIGTSQFSGSTGQLRYGSSGGNTYIYADVDGDRVTDMAIKLVGNFALTSADFWL